MPRVLEGLPVVGYETITVSTTAIGLTKAKYDKVPPAIGARITIDTAPIRWTADGSTTPTSSEGNFGIPTQAPLELTANELPNFSAIRQGSSDAKLRVTYYGAG